MDAASAYERTARGLPPLPDTPGLPGAAPPCFPRELPALVHQRLHDQAADAAARALDVLQGTGDGCLDLDRRSDLARLGAALPSDWDVDQLAWRAGLRPVALRELVLAWKAGGRAASKLVAAAGPVCGEPSQQRREAAPAVEQLSFF